MLILVLLSLATISPYFFKKSANWSFFLANLLKNPVSSAADIGFLFLGSTNLSKKCLSVITTSNGSNCLSAYLSICCKSDIGISDKILSTCISLVSSGNFFLIVFTIQLPFFSIVVLIPILNSRIASFLSYDTPYLSLG